MSLKERIEASPVVFLLGALLVGFTSGLATYKTILEIAHLEVVSSAEVATLHNRPAALPAKSSAPGQTDDSCPTIAGDWNYQTRAERIPLILKQTGCRVSGTYENSRRKYTINAEYSNGAFLGTLLKAPKAAGDCSSELPLLIRANNERTSLTMVTTGMDCDGSAADAPGIWVHG